MVENGLPSPNLTLSVLPPNATGIDVCHGSENTFLVAAVLSLAAVTCVCIGLSCRRAPRNLLRQQQPHHVTEVDRLFFTRRPLALELAFIIFLAIWIFYAFREFRFVEESPQFLEGVVIFVLLDIGVFVHVGVQFRRSSPTSLSLWSRFRRSLRSTLSHVMYCLFVGMPIGSLTKVLFALWQVQLVASWVVLLPYLLALGVACILMPAVAFYVILHRYQTALPATRNWKTKLGGLLVAVVAVAVWFYGFIMLESFLSENHDVTRVCWTMRMLPVLAIPVAAIIATMLYPLYSGKGEIVWYQPEVVFFLCMLGVAVPVLSWVHETQSRVQTAWYSMVPLFLCCIHQMMFFALCIANPLSIDAIPDGAGRAVEVAPPRVDLTVRRRELRGALRGTNVMKLGANWIMMRRQIIQNVAIMPKPPNIDGEKCSICLEVFTEDTEDVNIGYLHRCGHIFHFDCVWRWIDEKSKCPLCREGVKITKDDMSLLSLAELRDLFHTRQRAASDARSLKSVAGQRGVASDAKSLKSVRSSATVHTTVCFLPDAGDGVAREATPEPSPSHTAPAADTSYDYEDMDREITRIFSIVLPDTYPDNLNQADGFPYVPEACTLCMESYEDGDTDVGYIMPCMHFFHVHCIVGWVNQYNVCPHCPLGRRLLDDDDIYVMSLGNLLVSLDEVKPWEVYG